MLLSEHCFSYKIKCLDSPLPFKVGYDNDIRDNETLQLFIYDVIVVYSILVSHTITLELLYQPFCPDRKRRGVKGVKNYCYGHVTKDARFPIRHFTELEKNPDAGIYRRKI